MSLRYGVIALARPTFDMEFAEQMKQHAFAALERAGIERVGGDELACDAAGADAAWEVIRAAGEIDLLLLLQVTFTDAGMTVDLANRSQAPVALWGIPEPRLGGRLRLNALCGINLAAHALGKQDMAYRWLYATPDAPGLAERLRELAGRRPEPVTAAREVGKVPHADAEQIVDWLTHARISVIGEHPAGFDTCAFDGRMLHGLTGVTVTANPIGEAFRRAEECPAERAETHHREAAGYLHGLDDVDQAELDRSFRLLCALEDIAAEQTADAIAVRCWPETFTEYGCAACGPMAMMNQKGVPSACEADVHGALSSAILGRIARSPSWMADLVDVDEAGDTAVLWHCGLAPISMCDPQSEARATVHTNRRKPLLHEFPLRPGRITIARFSTARDDNLLVLAGAEVLRAPKAFTGTSGVIRFDRPAGDVLAAIMDQALEHHFSVVYGDHRETLRQVASRLDLPVLDLC